MLMALEAWVAAHVLPCDKCETPKKRGYRATFLSKKLLWGICHAVLPNAWHVDVWKACKKKKKWVPAPRKCKWGTLGRAMFFGYCSFKLGRLLVSITRISFGLFYFPGILGGPAPHILTFSWYGRALWRQIRRLVLCLWLSSGANHNLPCSASGPTICLQVCRGEALMNWQF